MEFVKAERKKARLRLALAGPSGSGKTWSALAIATGLGGKIAVIDTEHESASLYADQFEFDTLSLQAPYSPERFIAAIDAAEKAKFDVLVIDSYSHEWSGSGGCLEINETVAGVKFKGNTWAAWNETTPRHRKLIDRILASPLHIIATMRSKTETVQGENKKVIKLGMKSEQREGTDYEFTTVLDLQHDSHIATTSKDRTGLFSDPFLISSDTGKTLRDWLGSGVDPLTRAIQLSKGLIDEISKAPDMSSLQSAFAAAWVEVKTFPSVADQVMAAKDKRKAELTPADVVTKPLTQPKSSASATQAMNAVREAIVADIAASQFVEDFDAIEDRIARLGNDDRDYCYDAIEQKKLELEGHTQEYIVPITEAEMFIDESFPDILITEETLAQDIEVADTVDRIDRVIRQIEHHDNQVERTRLLKTASAKRRSLKTHEQDDAA